MTDKSTNNNDNQWICGRTDCFETCVDGPDKKGCCRAGFACRPTKNNDRWFCNRPLDKGGKCQDGPLENGDCSIAIPPCQPIRSKKAKFKILTRLIILFSIGLFLLIFGAEIWSKQLSPGKISSSHSGNISCNNCHSNFNLTPLNSLHLLLTNKLHADDSNTCLTCHHIGHHPFKAHNQPTLILKQLKKEAQQSAPSTSSLLNHVSQLVLEGDLPHRKLRCTTCHKEHHGDQAMLLKITQHTCQSCHAYRFSEFKDHPEFHQYPHKTRTHLFLIISHILINILKTHHSTNTRPSSV